MARAGGCTVLVLKGGGRGDGKQEVVLHDLRKVKFLQFVLGRDLRSHIRF